MERTKTDLEFAFLQIERLETKITTLTRKISLIAAQHLSTHRDEEELAALLRAVEILRAHFAAPTDPIKAQGRG
jgi:hypothetical protein